MASRVGNPGDGQPTDGASASSSDASQSRHSRDEQPKDGPSRESSIEYIGIIRKTNRILSRLPNQVLISILGGKGLTFFKCLGVRPLELKFAFLELELKLGSYVRIMAPLRAQIGWYSLYSF